jgi:hypothetical protein
MQLMLLMHLKPEEADDESRRNASDRDHSPDYTGGETRQALSPLFASTAQSAFWEAKT